MGFSAISFMMFETVTDVCLRSVDVEENTNCNSCNPCHSSRTNPEHNPNCSNGCNFSYNGGAGAGTADCCGPCEDRIDLPQKPFCTLDKSCCSNYEGELKNKVPSEGCHREFDPEKLIFGHKMGSEHYKKLHIEHGADNNCCETFYEDKLLGSRTCCSMSSKNHGLDRHGNICSGEKKCNVYETELVNKKPSCCGCPEDSCGCTSGCNYLARRN